jgi:hypothetical protein
VGFLSGRKEERRGESAGAAADKSMEIGPHI